MTKKILKTLRSVGPSGLPRAALENMSYHQEVYRLSRIIEFLLHVWAFLLLVLDLQLSF